MKKWIEENKETINDYTGDGECTGQITFIEVRELEAYLADKVVLPREPSEDMLECITYDINYCEVSVREMYRRLLSESQKEQE